jgi:putative oxidoreductase
VITQLLKQYSRLVSGLEAWIAPIFDLAIRLYIAKIFFWSGLTKIQSWSTTLALFEYEYAVPLLPTDVAAVLGTAAELILPPLLVLGLVTRPAAIALFVFNFIAATSYPDISEAGLKDHFHWGFLMLVPLFHGPGKLSLDHLIRRYLDVTAK